VAPSRNYLPMQEEQQAPIHRDHVVLGMAAGMGAYFMFSVMVLFAKLLSTNHSVIEIAFYRNLIGSLPFLFVVFALGRRDILVLRTRPAMVGFRAIRCVLACNATDHPALPRSF